MVIERITLIVTGIKIDFVDGNGEKNSLTILNSENHYCNKISFSVTSFAYSQVCGLLAAKEAARILYKEIRSKEFGIVCG